MTFELRVRNLQRDDRGQSLSKIFAGDRHVLGQQFIVFGVAIERTSQSGTETRNVRSTFVSINVVSVRVNVFFDVGRVLESYFVTNRITFPRNINHVSVNRIRGPVEMFDVLDDSPLVVEFVTVTGASVFEMHPDATV